MPLTPQEAISSVGRFIDNAKDKMNDRMERGLREISRLRWWELWKAPDIACRTLGTGKYWNAEFKDK